MAFDAALWEEKSKKRAVRVQQTLKREAITQKLRSEAVSAGMQQGMSWEDIAKKTKVPLSFVQSYSQQVNPNYGIKPTDTRSNIQKAGGLAKGLGEALASSYNRVGTGVAEVLGSDAQARANQAVAQADTASTDLIRKAGRQLQDPNVPAAKKARIRELIGQVSNQTEKSFAINNAINKQIQERTDPTKGAAAVGSIGLDILTGGTIGNAATAGTKTLAKEVASGAFQGALGGGLGAVEQQGKNVNLKNIAQGAGVGAALGGGLTAASGLLGDAVSKKITDLKKPTSISAPPVTKQDLNTTIHLPDKGVYARVTPEQAAILRNEVKNVKSAAGDIVHLSANTPALQRGAKEVTLGEISNLSPNANKTLSKLSTESPTLVQPVNNTAVSSAAARTEAEALKKNIIQDSGNAPTRQVVNMAEQSNKVVDTMNADYEAAKRIAFGQQKAPEGISAEAFYKGVKERAIREKDVPTINALIKDNAVSLGASKKGADIRALRGNEAGDPIKALQDIQKLRTKSVNPKLPKDLSEEEVKQVTDLASTFQANKAKSTLEGDKLLFNSKADREAYGKSLVEFDAYVNALKNAATPNELERIRKNPLQVIKIAGENTKAIKAALDNSAILRQGWKTMMTNPIIWQKNARKSFVDIYKTFKGDDVLSAVKADILSRENSPLYKRANLDVGVAHEEAFPTSLPEKIPYLGRFFKASDTAYTAFLHRQRADVFDRYIEIARKNGAELSKDRVESFGKLVNSLTGRGRLGKNDKGLDAVNALFFSPRNLKANIDTLTAHAADKNLTADARKLAATNLVKIISGTAAVLATANALRPGSVEWDPRSSDFGKIKIGNTRFEVTGGMASIATLAARLAMNSTKSTTTKQVTKLGGDEFGARTGWDVLLNFGEGKLSPTASTVKNILTGKDFTGNKTTVGGEIKNLFMPLPISNYQELKNDPKSANTLVAMIADGLGVGTNTYSAQKDWNQSNTKKINGFKQTVDAKKFSEANNAFNEAYSSWIEKATSSDKFKKLPEQTQKTLLSQKSQDLTDEILKKYGYEYKVQRKSPEESQTIKDLKGL